MTASTHLPTPNIFAKTIVEFGLTTTATANNQKITQPTISLPFKPPDRNLLKTFNKTKRKNTTKII